MVETFSLDWVVSLALATVRATAFLVICPPFNNRAISGQLKALLGLALGLATYDLVEPVQDTATFLVTAILQAFIGFALGFVIFVAIEAIRAAGSLIDLSGGFSMAQAFDPMSMTNGAVFSKLYGWLALVLLFVTNGYQLVILGLARSFWAVPVGAQFSWGTLASQLSTASGQLLVAAMEIGGPLLIVLFLTDIGLGLLTRVAPALNAFALGFPLKILITVLIVPTLILAAPIVVDKTLMNGLEMMSRVSQ